MENNITDLIRLFKSIPKHKDERTYLEIMKKEEKENVISNILSFFLNPNEKHGLKDLFIDTLVEVLKIEKSCLGDFSSVKTEDATQKGRIDIVIEFERYVIGIENKIRASLTNDLNDYEKRLKNTNKKYTLVVLSMKDSRSDPQLKNEDKRKNIRYKTFVNKLEKKIDKKTDNFMLDDFIKTLRHLIKRDTASFNKEEREFLKKYEKYTKDLIDRNKSDRSKEEKEFLKKYEEDINNLMIKYRIKLIDYLETEIGKNYSEEFEDPWCFRGKKNVEAHFKIKNSECCISLIIGDNYNNYNKNNNQAAFLYVLIYRGSKNYRKGTERLNNSWYYYPEYTTSIKKSIYAKEEDFLGEVTTKMKELLKKWRTNR